MGMGLICKECGTRLRVPESAAGELGKCPNCGELIRIPATTYHKARICDHCGKPLAHDSKIHELPGKAYCGKCFLEIRDSKGKPADLVYDDLGLKPMTPEDKAASVAKPRKLAKGQRAADIFLIRLLTEQGILEEKNIQLILKVQQAVGKRLIPLMRDIDLIAEEDIVKSVCETTGLEPCPPGKLEIAEGVRGLLDDKIMSRFDVVPMKQDDNAVYVALPNPLDISAVKKLREVLATVVVPRVCTWSQYTAGRHFLRTATKA